ncbi:MAG: transporter [Gammaproteobacteria bacterium]|nr:transporter [Gammaproteobacteria bacterium]MCP5201768.1 transporter [Gammaproteobacteria bacterium]
MTGLNYHTVLGLLLFAVLLAAGQVLFKVTALELGPASGLANLSQLVRSPYAWTACALYATATVLWIVLLKTVPLSIAYPFVALGFVVVPAAAAIWFDEPVSLRYAAGVACILVGIYLTQVPPAR